MRRPFTRTVFKTLKIAGLATGILILLLFLLPYLFPGFVSTRIRQWARGSVNSELSFSSARLSFFRHFPALTLTLYDFKLKGSAPFEKETLLEADEVALGVDLTSVFSELKINKLFLTNAFINIQVDSSGQANYNVYASKSKNTTQPADSSGTSLKIKKIIIENSKMVYNDMSLPILINMRGIDYRGSGDLSEAVFDLQTRMNVASMDLYYNHQSYFVDKKINADLITKINTSSLALFFEKNNLIINQLPVDFTGRFEFLKDGYDMDFKLKSENSQLHDILTALPPTVLDWVGKMDVNGRGDIYAELKGKYISSTGIMPDLILNMMVRDGYVNNAQAPAPIQNLLLGFRSRLPGLNPDSVSAIVDTVFFNMGKDYFSGSLQFRGLSQPWIKARVFSEMDLAGWNKIAGIKTIDLRGRYDIQADAEGQYSTKVISHVGLRKTTYDTVITSIPKFTIHSALSNGYFKYASLPEAVKDISFKLDASCADNDYKNTRIDLRNINASLLGSYIRGFLKLGNAHDFPVDASLRSVINLADLKKAIPMDSLELGGDLAVNISTYGNYLPARKLFPITVANLKLTGGSIRTKYYPHPLENIQVSARISNSTGTLKSTEVSITPFSFLLEGQPFMLKANLQNFQDLRYNITSRGMLDLGKIYQVFAIKGYDVKGFVQTDLSLKGRQSDAQNGRYDRLYNSGTLKVRELQLSSELFPMPFLIKKGLFRFDQDKMWFDQFDLRYGKTNASLNGWLSNIMGYMTDKSQPVTGHFDLGSDYLLADEFMAFADGAGAAPPSSNVSFASYKPGSSSAAHPLSVSPASSIPGPPVSTNPSLPAGQTGVVLVPSNISVSFNAKVKKIRYNGIDLNDFTGGMTVDSGMLRLDTTKFTLIGAPVEMSAWYKPQSPQRAQFDYKIKAKDFDVQRAYREVKIFHDLAASAAKAQGIISLDYQLAGKLDGNMHPVYPSLKGGGVLSIARVKVKGLKLFSAVSKETNKDVTDPDLSKVDIKTTINNNIITLPRTRMKVSVFRLRMEGQASLDGRLNLQFRVGLPPFGLIGIPVKITGTQENPKVRAGHTKKGDQLEETEDKDEEEPHPAETNGNTR
ncbi:MAG TPA: AsmA-like C-terminal region-containing protein [Puia sp.]|nr:AsmA-like C-terminal region-containing protein [Puia sp.]